MPNEQTKGRPMCVACGTDQEHVRATLETGGVVHLCPGYRTFWRAYDGPNDYTATDADVMREIAHDAGLSVAELERRLVPEGPR